MSFRDAREGPTVRDALEGGGHTGGLRPVSERGSEGEGTPWSAALQHTETHLVCGPSQCSPGCHTSLARSLRFRRSPSSCFVNGFAVAFASQASELTAGLRRPPPMHSGDSDDDGGGRPGFPSILLRLSTASMDLAARADLPPRVAPLGMRLAGPVGAEDARGRAQPVRNRPQQDAPAQRSR